LFNEVSKYGTANVKRIYGDWTTPNLASWKNSLNKFAIQPIQQFRYTVGKNASDSALIIDAMDILHSRNVDGFCIVSSDSDFTRLACRIRESGLSVYGFGKQNTPEQFVRACDRFIYVENLTRVERNEEAASKPKPVGVQPAMASATKVVQALDSKQMGLIRSAFDSLAPEGGWVALAALGSQIRKLSPSFDSRTYGFKKLSDLISSLNDFKLDNRPDEGKSRVKYVYVTLKGRTRRL